ncbi:sulfotransferase [Alcanivorax sp. S6407]|nr:tetratricopeptide repeat-containing sulfotransferase family protein [Alcanivorax sp. S6407]MCK0152573.1 sulfotransferase [Alcanivorax sp. S6407]
MGQLLLRANQADKAESLYAPLSQSGQLDHKQRCGYARVLMAVGKLQQAADQFQRVLGSDAENQEAWLGLGEILAQTGDHETAASTFRKLLMLDKENDYYAALLSRELIASLHYGKARAVVKRLTARMPDNLAMKLAYSEVLAKLGQDRLAINVLKSIEINKENFTTIHFRLVHSCASVGDSEGLAESLERLREAGSIQALPVMEQKQLELLRCKNLLQQGKKDEARAALMSLVEGEPSLPGPWYQLADSMPDQFDDETLAAMQALAEKASDAAVKSLFLFAVGMVLEKRGDKAAEVAAYEQANALGEAFNPYNPEAVKVGTERCISVYTRDWIESRQGIGDSSFRPVFILGMPRSGTTLLEQVLGAHPQVETAGESTVMECAITERMEALEIENRNQYMNETLHNDEIARLAGSFRELIAEVAESDTPFIVEKGMNNPRDAGLLSVMFPNARFVYIRRHPLDVAWGCFKQNFATQNFSFSYLGIANQFSTFQSLVRHWQEVLPQGLFELSYEALVGDMRGTVEGLLKYVGLPWDDACLSFDKRNKEVVTASMNQIRQGLFTSAVGRWEKYGDLLLPLKHELERAGVDLNYRP